MDVTAQRESYGESRKGIKLIEIKPIIVERMATMKEK